MASLEIVNCGADCTAVGVEEGGRYSDSWPGVADMAMTSNILRPAVRIAVAYLCQVYNAASGTIEI